MEGLDATRVQRFGIDPARFSEYKVFPRLLFGEYLTDQFDLLLDKGKSMGIKTTLHLNTHVSDLRDNEPDEKVVVTADDITAEFDYVIICSGHNWPCRNEGTIPGYFDSPYPPAKLEKKFNHEIAVKGSSLTAIDAIRTLARHNGSFIKETGQRLRFIADPATPEFRMVMHSIDGLLPAIRFHLDDSHLSGDNLLTEKEILEHLVQNDGYLSLDFIFEKDFKEGLKKKDPALYEKIRHQSVEEFVAGIMPAREAMDPFVLFRREYEEADRSIRNHESVHWKELLAILSFAMNYPAKHFSAEDMLRLKKTLMPLISVVIAFVPQSSCEELLALHEAGKLQLVDVSKESRIHAEKKGGVTYQYDDGSEKYFTTFINGTGQPHLELADFPFPTLVKEGTLSPALLRFRDKTAGHKMLEEKPDEIVERDGVYFLKVPGIAITDTFRVVGADNVHNPRIRLMAVPYMGGYNPDYSGLDFCEEASRHIVDDLFSQ
ncbi:MAG: hypothetical protein EOP49_02510 [Sphingobacteriales bacterium]|nr:MAG: hypothetical protein EOP49_02510 [Sphingobacteriales bacterium]